MQLIPQPNHGPTQRYWREGQQMSRHERRLFEHMRPGDRVEEARRMYNELRKWAIAKNDEGIAYNLVKKFYPYVRMDRPLAMSKAKSEELRKLYDGTRTDYQIAHREDAMKMESV